MYATYLQLTNAYNEELLMRLGTRAGEYPVDPVTVEARGTEALLAASGLIDGYLLGRYAVPVQSSSAAFMAALAQCCCALAVMELMMQKGYLPDSEDESLVIGAQKRYLNKPNGWLYLIGNGSISIPGASSTGDGTQATPEEGYVIVSEEPFFPPASKFR